MTYLCSVSTAAKLKKGELVKINAVSPSPYREKLLEMGCTPGTLVYKVHEAPFGCPITFDIDGYQLALRKAEAETILVI